MGISGRVLAPQDELSPYINDALATPFLAQKPSCRILCDPPPTPCQLKAYRTKTSTEGGSLSYSTTMGRIIRVGGPLEHCTRRRRASRRGVHHCENIPR
jgi:hypothetical protein